MKTRPLKVLAGFTLAFLAVQASAQTTEPERDFVTPYLEQKRAEFEQQDRKLTAAGKANIAKGIYSVLIARDPLATKDVIGNARKDEVRSALLRTLANYLASVGKNPSDLNSALKSGISPVEAAANVLFYRPNTVQEYWAAEAVAIGRLMSVETVSGTAGIGSAARFEILESLKGPYQAGSSVQVMQASGADVTIAGELGSRDSGEYLLLLSPTRYAAFTGTRPDPKSDRALVQFSSYKIVDGTLRGTGYDSPSSGKTLEAYRTEVQ